MFNPRNKTQEEALDAIVSNLGKLGPNNSQDALFQLSKMIQNNNNNNKSATDSVGQSSASAASNNTTPVQNQNTQNILLQQMLAQQQLQYQQQQSSAVASSKGTYGGMSATSAGQMQQHLIALRAENQATLNQLQQQQ